MITAGEPTKTKYGKNSLATGNDRTCLPDAIWNLLFEVLAKRDVRVEDLRDAVMPKEGNTHINDCKPTFFSTVSRFAKLPSPKRRVVARWLCCAAARGCFSCNSR